MITTYTVKKVVFGVPQTGRIDTQVYIDTSDQSVYRHKLADLKPLKPVDDVVIAQVGDKTAIEITKLGDGHYEGSFSILCIDDLAYYYWNEFAECTRHAEPFTLDCSMHRLHNGIYSVYRTPNQFNPSLPDIEVGSEFTIPFTVLN